MTEKIKILIVEDSILIRKLLTEIVESDSELEVCATASNGKIALGKIYYFKPDVITLDLEMPEMNGIETLKEIKKNYPDIPVIIVSSSSYHSASSTFECLQLGASDYITKPEGIADRNVISKYLKDTLLPKLKTFGFLKSLKSSRAKTEINISDRKSYVINQKFDLVCIGISTGGTIVLNNLIPLMPKNFPIPIVVIIHMPAVFSKSFAERLNKISHLEVVEIEDGQSCQSGHVYIAPGDFHVLLVRKNQEIIFELNSSEKVNFCRPSVDVFFSSAAMIFKEKTLGMILTGMGVDGLNGAKDIKANGGIVIAQDENSSTVWGMPGAVVKAGLADSILSIDEITLMLGKLVN